MSSRPCGTAWRSGSPSPVRRATPSPIASSPSSDRAFSGKMGGILCPALFATGELDPNSTPAMAEAMAAASVRGRSAVIPQARHMMTVTAPGRDQCAAAAASRRAAQHLREPRTPHRLRQLHDGRHHRDHGGHRRHAARLHRQQLHVRLARAAAAPDLHRQVGGQRRRVPAGQGLCRQHPVGAAEGYLGSLRLEARRQVRGGDLAQGPLRQPADRGLGRVVRLRPLPGDRCRRPHHPHGPHRGLFLFRRQPAGLCARRLHHAGPRAGGGQCGLVRPAARSWAPYSKTKAAWC